MADITMEIVACNLCGSSNYSPLYKLPDLLLDKKEELFTIVKCNQCGLVFQNPRPTQAEISKYYPPEYEPFYQEQSGNQLLRKINRHGIEKRCRIINTIQQKDSRGSLLDIGCSTGLFMNELRKSGQWDVKGIEISDYAANIAREKFHLDVYTGSLSDANYPADYFDVVTMWDVLEHIPDPSTTLVEISRITKPQGYLVLRIPDYDSLDAKLFGPAWAGLDCPRHYYAFSRRNIRRFLERNGFAIIKIRGGIGTYPTFTLNLQFWLTLKSVDKTAREKISRLLNNPLSKLVSAPIFYFYGLFLLGSEIVVIASNHK